jgi:hypothetical protein
VTPALRLAVVLGLCACLTACQTTPPTGPGPKPAANFDPGQIGKSDIDRVADTHRRELLVSLRLVADKLYRRNPREWRRAGHASQDDALDRLFDPGKAFRLPEFEGKWGTELVLVALREDYRGDRVAAFIGGLGGMLDAAFEGKREFFMFDDIDPQKLHNSARNLEIAAWKLGQARDGAGNLLLFSNEMSPGYNLSFEREFGKMIGSLDLLAALIVDKTQRTLAKVIQNVATAVFLPVSLLPGLK